MHPWECNNGHIKAFTHEWKPKTSVCPQISYKKQIVFFWKDTYFSHSVQAWILDNTVLFVNEKE